MFGIIRPCRNRLSEELRLAWLAHLCGMCLSLRDRHGQLSRLVTNFDAVVVSALVEAQTGTDGRRREAGPCALRGMRSASVAVGGSAELAASVSLLLASAKIDDHLVDGDIAGAVRTRAARAAAGRWSRAGRASGAALGLDGELLLAAVADQADVEAAPRSILEVTAPTETATALAFRHTAVVAEQPGNIEALAEAGRLFGRVAHLLDAVEDLHADRALRAWNPILALGISPHELRRLCDDAALGIRLALRDATFADGRLVHALLVHEVTAAIDRTFATAGRPAPLTPPPSPDQQPPGGPPIPPGTGWEAPPETPKQRNPVLGCLGWLVVCGTCQACCAGEFTDPCSGRKRAGLCRGDGGSSCGDCWCPGDCDCDCCCDGCDCDCGC
ncbi:MAG TPA: DUF5685 family protein [Jatrophihabitans sp.]|jgi:hypothetical protein|uniref:DUF5685 family protein n=1 Tax=Jatrophihabitans sp. TaxID=1932789 RepID=UPI002DFFD431|nr:DUF5685 family protein [Jatrophihabitans sp.]